MLYTYDPREVVVTFRGIPLTGFADGTFMNLERTEDTFTESTGASGETSRAKSNNRSASLELTLQQTSPSNDVLSIAHSQDEKANAGVGEVLVKDAKGTTLVVSPAAYVKKPPAVEYGKEITGRAWTLFLSECEIFVGGNTPQSIA